jgi:chemotaxis protein MotB
MKAAVRQTAYVFTALILISVISGCTDWKKKYQGLEVEHKNLLGRYDRCMSSLDSSAAEKAKLSQRLMDMQKTIEQLQAMEKSGPNIEGGIDWVPDASKGTLTATLSNEILFSPGQATLKKDTIGELDSVMTVLRQKYPTQDISVVGHTDTDPILKTAKLWKDNWELSTERSLAVVRYLVQHGLTPKRVVAAGAGEFRPVGSNSTASGKAKNRRVEIVIHLL